MQDLARTALGPLLGSLRLSLLGCLCAAPLAAQSPGEAAPAERSGAQQAELARATPRLVHLTDGGVLRARARWNGEQWEIEAADGWRALPAPAVARVRSEREVLAESRKLARTVGRDDTTKRVALADWMLREGLAREALEELDGVLASEPDHPAALALLAAPPQPLAVGAFEDLAPSELLRRAAGAPAALRELALLRLAELEQGEALRASLAQGLQAPMARERAFAAQGLRRLCPGSEVRGLSVRAVLDGSPQVRSEAALALGNVRDEAVILPALRALESSNAAVRSNAIEALGVMGYPAAVPALVAHLSALQSGSTSPAPRSHIFVGHQMAYIQDFDVEVAQGAAIADPMVNTLTEGSVLDVRVIGVNVMTGAVEASRVRRSLAQLVGEERSSRGWLAWWKDHEGHDATSSPGGQRPTTGG